MTINWDGSRPDHKHVEIGLVESPTSTDLMPDQLSRIEQTVHCRAADPEELGRFLKCKKDIALPKSLSFHT